MIRTILCATGGFVLLGSVLQTQALTIVNVAAPNVNCHFDANPSNPPFGCTIVVTDTTEMIPLVGGAGSNFLQSRTFTPKAGSEAAGLYGYMYRIDLRQATPTDGLPCVDIFTIEQGKPCEACREVDQRPAALPVHSVPRASSRRRASGGGVLSVSHLRPPAPARLRNRAPLNQRERPAEAWEVGLTPPEPPRRLEGVARA